MPKSSPAAFAGIDVGSTTLQLCLRDRDGAMLRELNCANTAAEHRRLIGLLRRVRTVLEATSNYSLDLVLALHEAGVPVVLLNPRQSRDFAHSLNRRAKTDRVDAAVLAEAARVLDLPLFAPPEADVLKLRALSRTSFELTEQRSAIKNRLHAVNSSKSLGSEVAASLNRQISFLKEELKLVEEAALAIIADNAGLTRRLEQVTSIKGCALLTGWRLMAELSYIPEGLSARQWTAWAGLDPRPCESGQFKGKRRLSKQGSRYLRQALYMPAFIAKKHEPAFAQFYQRLLANGKPKMLAICAVMRKLLCVLWAMLNKDQLFDGAKLMPKTACF